MKPRCFSLLTLLGLLLAVGSCSVAVAGQRCPALDSPRDAYLQHAAQVYADFMAAHETQRYGGSGHFGFDGRFAWLTRKRGAGNYAEITAESWPWHAAADEQTLWIDATESWRQSPGHWRCARRPHQAVGAAMAKSARGIWYFCVIAGD